MSHEVMVRLRNEGALSLGIRDDLAERITQIKGLGPSKSSATAAFKFWNLVGFGALFYTLYLSFTSDWWWFIVGFFSAGFVFNVNKKSNSENMLDAAFVDKEFYDRVLELNGWMYRVEEGCAAKVEAEANCDS